jgi:hypothetical protein
MNNVMVVRVYRNLHKKCLSVLHRTRTGWRLWKHAPSIQLRNVAFKVSIAGRNRVLHNKRKNVHAFAQGELCNDAKMHLNHQRCIKYDPYIAAHFFDVETKQCITHCTWALINEQGIHTTT